MTDARIDGHRFVFVTGLHRSGTSLLHETLRSHPDVSGFSGTGAPQDEGQHLQALVPTGRDLGGPGRFAFDPTAHLTESSPLATPETATGLIEQWSAHWDLDRAVLVEKSPPTLVRTRFFQALFPESWFVVVVRHPLVASLATRKWTGDQSIGSLVDHWLRCHEIFRGDAPHLRRVVVLKFEDLCADPDGALRRMAAFLELDDRFPRPTIQDTTRRYEEQWAERTSRVAGRADAALMRLRFERRCRSFGYSLQDLRRSDPLPPDLRAVDVP